ncbi:hypothetical protein HKX48_001481, partial [Thoreauomyces humboldtii]
MKISVLATLATLALTTGVQSLGINCRGSGMCLGAPENALARIKAHILSADLTNDRVFRDGDHIACVPSGIKHTSGGI